MKWELLFQFCRKFHSTKFHKFTQAMREDEGLNGRNKGILEKWHGAVQIGRTKKPEVGGQNESGKSDI